MPPLPVGSCTCPLAPVLDLAAAVPLPLPDPRLVAGLAALTGAGAAMEANRSSDLGAVTALRCCVAAAALAPPAVPAGRVAPSGFFTALALLAVTPPPLEAVGLELRMFDEPGPAGGPAVCAVTTTGRCCAAWMRDSDALAGTAASSSSSRSSQPSPSSSTVASASPLARDSRPGTPLKGGEEYLEAEEKASSSGSEMEREREMERDKGDERKGGED